MFDKLAQVEARYKELENQLAAPDILSRQAQFQKLAKERSDIAEIVDAYRAYKRTTDALAENAPLLRESDSELRSMAREEEARLTAERTTLEERLKLLLLPKDPNDEKNIVLEIRGGTGGDTIYGGTGVDTIYGEQDNDTIFGESDPDKIYGGGGADTIDGGAGNNLIYGDDPDGESTGTEGGDIEERTDARLMREFIDRIFTRYLTPRERKILYLYYGLEEGSEALTLEKIGELLGVTRERIRQIRERAFEKLRESPDVKGLKGFWVAA